MATTNDEQGTNTSGILSGSLSRRTLLRGAALGAGAGLIGAGYGRASAMKSGTVVYDSSRAGATTISVWYPYGGVTLPAFLKLFKDFENANPGISVKATYAANDLSSNQKLFAAVAAGIPPDVTWVDGPEVSGWGFRGIIQPITSYLKTAGVNPNDFWAPCVRENTYQNQTWALPFTADPNFGFFWNKKVFAAAGIKEPPQTFDDLNKMIGELTIAKGGRITQVGMLPWNVYGFANSMVTWGWMFGGSFMDEAKNKITANDPQVVAALEWMVSLAKKYGVTNFAAFSAPFGGFGNGQAQMFAQGKLAMQPMGPWEIASMKSYNPAAQYGITQLPAYKNVGHSSWVGGWCVGIPKGAKQPEAAFQFIKWLCASDQGTVDLGKATSDFPGYKKSPFFNQLDAQLKLFYPILQSTQHQRPVTPAEDYYMGQLQTEVSNALYGKKTAKQALTDCTNNTQAYLNSVLKKH